MPRGTSITGKRGWGLAELYRGRTVSSDMMGIATSRPETVASARGGVQKIATAENVNEHMIEKEDEYEPERRSESTAVACPICELSRPLHT